MHFIESYILLTYNTTFSPVQYSWSYTMKHFVTWFNQLQKDSMVLFLLMDKLEQAKHIQCRVGLSTQNLLKKKLKPLKNKTI